MDKITLPFNFQPRDYQLPLLQAIDSGYTRAIQVWHRRCLLKGTPIAMADGSFKSIEEVTVGDVVVSFDGDRMSSGTVTDVYHNGTAEVFDYNGLWATPNHVVFSEGSWKEINKARCLTSFRGMVFGSVHAPELAEVLGLLLTDGYVKINQTPKFTNTTPEVLDRFEKLVVEAFPDVLPKRYKKGNGFDIVCPTRKKTVYHPIRRYFPSSNSMPDIVWKFDKESTLAFLAGVIAGDGSIYYKRTTTPRGFNCITGQMAIEAGISPTLAEQYRLLLLKFGIHAKVKKDPRYNNTRVFIYSLKEMVMLSGINIPYHKKQLRINEIIGGTKESRQKTITTYKTNKGVSTVGEVYDLRVEKTHSYVANGFIVHNCGKEKVDVNIVAKKMMERVGAYYYFFPTYTQGKKILWEGSDKAGFRFIDHFPKELRDGKPNDTEMKLRYKNGSLFQVVGADKIDSIVGTNPIGTVWSEYSIQNPKGWDFIRPILAENGGWAIFNWTPRGKNHAYDLHQMALEYPQHWFVSVITVDDTHAISPEVLEQECKEIIAKHGDDALFQQEYYCSYTASILGSYYASQYAQAEREGRFTHVPYDPLLPVHTVWDLGISDAMALGFYQAVGSERRMIDYEEYTGLGLPEVIKKVKEKPYVYGKHFAPHDIRVRELGTGKTRLQTAEELGIKFEVVPSVSVQDGIDIARAVFNKLWVDNDKCKDWLKLIPQYTKEYDENKHMFKDSPLHDWTSHGADEFRYFALVEDQMSSLGSFYRDAHVTVTDYSIDS